MYVAIMSKVPLVTCGIYLYHLPDKKILACHATHARWNQWSIPKGLRENEEQEAWEVAVRELAEETGINLAGLNIIKTVPLPPIAYQKQNKILHAFLVVTNSDLSDHLFQSNQTETGPQPEIDEWKWISLVQARTWLHESQVRQLDLIEKYIKNLSH